MQGVYNGANINAILEVFQTKIFLFPDMQPQSILENLSSHLKNVIAHAISLATAHQHDEVTPIHLILALHEEQGAVGAEILKKHGIHVDLLRAALLELPIPRGEEAHTATAVLPELNETARKALEKAMLLAYEHQHKYVGTEHLLYGILHVQASDVTALLKKHKLTKKEVLAEVELIVQSTSRFPDMEEVADAVEHMEQMAEEIVEAAAEQEQDDSVAEQTPKKKKKRSTKVRAIDVFAVELTNKELQKTIDPVIGRSEEIERLIHVLARRTKNNPVLVGEPGVGKTAIVEGLAKRIYEGDVPTVLKRKKIFSIDMALLISGTIYRGEFEARLKQIIDEVAKSPDVILFIDELHNIIGAGSNQGTMDAANILKPALARGQLRCIGATTHDEYTKYVAADPALERRFQEITIAEPSLAEATQILEGIKTQYEEYHQVKFAPEVVAAAVRLSNKYVHDNFLPDKAIDLIDEAAARVRVGKKETAAQKKHRELLDAIDNVQKEKEAAIAEEAFDKAMALKKQAQALEKKRVQQEKRLNTSKTKRPLVTEADVTAVLGARLRLNPAFITMDEWKDLDRTAEALKQAVFGQDHVIDTIVNTLRRAHLSPTSNRPVASMLFVGPSGVGKTTLAKELAKTLYHTEDALIQFDMSEFGEGHSVAKLLGSPAGYVGHKERNPFTEKIKKRPHAIILFDEIDKAHPDVLKLLMQMLDEGTLTDSSGKQLSFAHAIIILTSNVGSEIYKSAGIGFGQSGNDTAREEAINSRLKEVFDAALLGRMNAIHTFSPLQQDAIIALVKQHIAQMNAVLASRSNIQIKALKPTLEQLAEKAYNMDSGARHAAQVIEEVIHPLVLEALQKKYKAETTFTLKKTDTHFELV